MSCCCNDNGFVVCYHSKNFFTVRHWVSSQFQLVEFAANLVMCVCCWILDRMFGQLRKPTPIKSCRFKRAVFEGTADNPRTHNRDIIKPTLFEIRINKCCPKKICISEIALLKPRAFNIGIIELGSLKVAILKENVFQFSVTEIQPRQVEIFKPKNQFVWVVSEKYFG